MDGGTREAAAEGFIEGIPAGRHGTEGLLGLNSLCSKTFDRRTKLIESDGRDIRQPWNPHCVRVCIRTNAVKDLPGEAALPRFIRREKPLRDKFNIFT